MSESEQCELKAAIYVHAPLVCVRIRFSVKQSPTIEAFFNPEIGSVRYDGAGL